MGLFRDYTSLNRPALNKETCLINFQWYPSPKKRLINCWSFLRLYILQIDALLQMISDKWKPKRQNRPAFNKVTCSINFQWYPSPEKRLINCWSFCSTFFNVLSLSSPWALKKISSTKLSQLNTPAYEDQPFIKRHL